MVVLDFKSPVECALKNKLWLGKPLLLKHVLAGKAKNLLFSLPQNKTNVRRKEKRSRHR